MPTKISVIYDNPVDPAVFEEGYPAQLVLARGATGLEANRDCEGMAERGRYANAGLSNNRPLFRRLQGRK